MGPLLEVALLRTFVLLAETGSVTAVARRVGRTQPAISQQLRRLEEAAGRPLFEGDLRHPALTMHGLLLLDRARQILHLHDRAQAELRASEMVGRVRLGCPDLYAAFMLPPTLRGFRLSHPAVEVTVHCSLTRVLVAELSAGRLDLALTTGMPGVEPSTGVGTLLRRERLVWIGRPEGMAGRRRPLPLAMLPDGNLYRDYALAALQAAGIPWTITCQSESLAGLQAMALADAAITVLAESVAVPELASVGAEFDLPALPEVALVMWVRQPGADEAVDQLADHIANALRHDAR